ncbi:hypothetical protein [Caproiciproducens sp.]
METNDKNNITKEITAVHVNKYKGKWFKYSTWFREKPTTFDEMIDYAQAVLTDKNRSMNNRNSAILHCNGLTH